MIDPEPEPPMIDAVETEDADDDGLTPEAAATLLEEIARREAGKE